MTNDRSPGGARDCLVFSVPTETETTFADALATRLGTSRVPHYKASFASGEMLVEVPKDLPERALVVLSPVADRSDALVELMLLVDALSREGVRSITCVLQYLYYSRSNRLSRRGLSLGARVVISILEASPISRFLVFDLHSRDVLGFFTKPVLWAPTLSMMSDAVLPDEPEVVISPDRGRYDECVDLSKLRSSGFDLLVKVRRDDGDSSELVAGARTPLKGHSVLLFDDEIWTGQTAGHVITSLYEAGVSRIHYMTVYDFTTDRVRHRLLDDLGVASFTTTNLAQPAGPDFHERYQVLDVSQLALERLDLLVPSHASSAVDDMPYE